MGTTFKLPETRNYYIKVAPTLFGKNHKRFCSGNLYHVTNKHTGVSETIRSYLPYALGDMDEAQRELDNCCYNVNASVLSVNVIKLKDRGEK